MAVCAESSLGPVALLGRVRSERRHFRVSPVESWEKKMVGWKALVAVAIVFGQREEPISSPVQVWCCNGGYVSGHMGSCPALWSNICGPLLWTCITVLIGGAGLKCGGV